MTNDGAPRKPTKPIQRVLKDHKRVGRRFIPPLLVDDLLSPISWRNVLPELLWIGLLQGRFGDRRAAELTLSVVRAAEQVPMRQDQTMDAPIHGVSASWFGELDEASRVSLLGAIPESDLKDIGRATQPLRSLYHDFPMAFICGASGSQELDVEQALGELRPAVEALMDRRSRRATLCQADVLYGLLVVGRMFVTPGAARAIDTFPELEKYPDSDESREAASYTRALINMLFGHAESSTWSAQFWRKAINLTECEFANDFAFVPGTKEGLITLEKSFKKLALDLPSELSAAWTRLDPRLDNPLRGEVLSGLFARQARLLEVMLRNPQLWSDDLGKITSRCMLDNYFVLRWLVDKGSLADIRKFAEHGLGQDKLLLEHLRALVSSEDRGDLTERADDLERWINSQLLTIMLPVDVGSWNNVRETAHDLGDSELYNLHFAPYSSVVHGSWNAIAKQNLEVCLNPLHGGHRAPYFGPQGMDAMLVLNAIDLFETCYELWITALDGEILPLASLVQFDEALSALIGESP